LVPGTFCNNETDKNVAENILRVHHGPYFGTAVNCVKCNVVYKSKAYTAQVEALGVDCSWMITKHRLQRKNVFNQNEVFVISRSVVLVFVPSCSPEPQERPASGSLTATHGPAPETTRNIDLLELSSTTSRQTPSTPAANMSNALNKIAPNSPSRQNPSEIETSIANARRPVHHSLRCHC
jgi:hypothetical protein